MKSLRSYILLEMANLLLEADKREVVKKFGFSDRIVNYFHSIDSKLSPWFATIITNQFAKENGITGKNLTEIVAQIDEDELYLFAQQNRHKLHYIQDWIKNPRRPQNINLRAYNDLDQAYAGSEQWHQEIEKSATGVINDESGKVIKTYGDYYWIDLGTNNCPEESAAMGHCGKDSRATTLYSLRDKNTKEPHVTIAVNENTKLVHQVKGKQNKRPVDKYLSFVTDLLRNYFETGKLIGFNWSYSADLTENDLKQIFPDPFEYLAVVFNSPSLVRSISVTDEQIIDYLKHFIQYENIDSNNIIRIRKLVDRIIPKGTDLKTRFKTIHNKLVLQNIVIDNDNVVPLLISLEYDDINGPLHFMQQMGVSPEKLYETLRTTSSVNVILFMDHIPSGYAYVLKSRRELDVTVMAQCIIKMRQFIDDPEKAPVRTRTLETFIGDKIEILRGTEHAKEIAKIYPEIVEEFPPAQGIIPVLNESVKKTVKQMFEASSLFSDFMKRSQQTQKKSPATKVKNQSPKTKDPKPERSLSNTMYKPSNDLSKYSKIAASYTGANMDDGSKKMMVALDKKQNDFFATLKYMLSGFDVKPRERNLTDANRTYDFTITYKKYPLIVEHIVSIVPKNGYFNVQHFNKMSVDVSTYDAATINNLIKYKNPDTDVKKDGQYLVYTLPFNSKESIMNDTKFTDVNKIETIAKEMAEKIERYTDEMMRGYAKTYHP